MSTELVVALMLFGFLQVAFSQDNATAPPTDYCQSGLCPSLKKHIACKNKGVRLTFAGLNCFPTMVILFALGVGQTVFSRRPFGQSHWPAGPDPG